MQPASDKPRDSRGTDRPIRIGGTVLREQRHICAFFHSHADQYRVLLPFIKDGFECGEKAVDIVDPGRRNEHVQQLCLAGIDVAAAQQDGQLELREWAEAHLQGGFFDQGRTLALIDEIRRRAKEQGFPRIRFVTNMEWGARRSTRRGRLAGIRGERESCAFEDPVVCAYDLEKFGGDVVVDVMRTHPLIIIGGILQENPFFVPPGGFLRELRERRGPRQAASSVEDRRPV